MNILKKILYLINKKHIILILMILISIISTMLLWLQQEDTVIPSVKPTYHFYLVGQNSVDPFWKEVRQGAEDAAKDYNVVVEFNAPRFNNPQEERMYLDIAVTAKVDGIITHVSNGQSFRELIDRAYDLGIPVVTIENDAKNSNRSAFVGTNSFVLGKEAAKLMIDATNGKANIAIIVSNDYEMDSASQNLKINGFLSTIKEYSEMKVVQTYISKMGILSAEEITQSIINSQLDINAILTTNTVDTFGAAQLIVDQNKVGAITLIGYGDTVNILRYIKNNIIYGTVMSDPYKMGYEGVKALLDIKERNNVSTFIDTGVKVIRKSNMEEYEMKADMVE